MSDQPPLTEEDLQAIERVVAAGNEVSGNSVGRLIAEVRRYKAAEAAYSRYCLAMADMEAAMSPSQRKAQWERA